MNHINEEYKQPNKRELSDVPDPPVPCAEPEKILKWLTNAIILYCISRNDLMNICYQEILQSLSI